MKRNKLLVLFVLLLNVAGMTKGYAYDFSAVCPTGQTLYYNIIDATNHYVELTCPGAVGKTGWNGYTEPSDEITFTETVQNGDVTYAVTSIGNYAFYSCSGFNGSLTIGDSVESIGERAFQNCNKLTGSLNIPNSVTSIGQYAFSGCTDFDGSLTIGNSVTTISKYAFQDCSGFKHVTIGNSVTKIDSYAFRRCSNLASVTLLCTEPPTLGNNSVFSNTKNCPIYVPYESLKFYKEADLWSSIASRIYPWLQKSITGYGTSTESDKWVFIASPVSTVEGIAPVAVDNLIGSLIPESTLYDFDLYRFNQSADLEWENYNNTDHTEGFMLVNGQGYLYASKEDVNLVFKGTFNEDETKDVELVYDAGKELAGWNLVGNPFPVTATVTGRSYYVMNEAGTGINPEAVSAGGTIAACTGIVVKAEENETDPQVTFTRTTQQSAANQGTLQIAVAQNNIRSNAIQDNTIVSFNEGDQLAKFYFGKQNANIYIPQGAEEYAIAYSNGQGEMPLNLKAKEDGQYTISVNPENVEMNYLHLIDNITGADIDLLAPEPVEGSASYTFTAKTTDYESRFRLVFSANGTSTGSATDEIFAYFADGEIIIMANVCDASLQVIDLMGRVVYRGDAINRVSTGGMVSGVYVMRLIKGENVKTQKIVIE